MLRSTVEAPLDATRLTSDQEAALAACFAALEAEPPVGRYARAIGKISLDELSLCLKALKAQEARQGYARTS